MESYELEKSDFAALPDNEREKALDDNAQTKIKAYSYSRQLTKLEIDKKNVELNQALQEIERLKTERKEYNKLIKTQWDIVTENSKEVVRERADMVETVWEINDFNAGFMQIVNAEGLIISKTRLKGGVQMNIFNAQKEAI